MIKYFLYTRKSTDEEDRQILSIESQLKELREFARKENLTIVKEFTESKTAKEPGREVFNEMLELIEKGKAEGILAWHPDRLARNSIDGGKIIYLIDTGKLKDLKFPSVLSDHNKQGGGQARRGSKVLNCEFYLSSLSLSYLFLKQCDNLLREILFSAVRL